MSQPEGGPPELNFTPKPSGGTRSKYTRRPNRRRSPMILLAPFMLGAIAIAGGLALLWLNSSPKVAPAVTLGPISDQTVTELDTLVVDASATVSPGCEASPVFWLVDAPAGAAIDAASGRFTWEPTETQGPGEYPITIGVTLDTHKETLAESRFAVSAMEDNQPPIFEPIAGQKVKPGESLALTITASDPDEPARRIQYRLMPNTPSGATIDANSGVFTWTPGDSDAGKTHDIAIEAREAVERGEATLTTLRVTVEAPPPEMQPRVEMVEKAPVIEEPVVVAPSPEEHGKEVVLKLHERRRLFHLAEYATLRKVFAERFAMRHEADIRDAWGDDDEALTQWLDEHIDLKETLFTAIDPDVDNAPAALELFREMWKLSPEVLADYGNLAIAVAVTWDQKGGVYDYGRHQRRTRSSMPTGLLGAIDNYKYIVQNEPAMQGRGQFLPWEFLVYVVNHKTPVDERMWALQQYLPKRAMFGKCYSKVPYDSKLRDKEGASLKGHPYILPNILTYGGVCAMQADFAARVGMSLGVPSAYVGGKSRYGGSHAWVMWVELQAVNQKGLAFKLESHGRYGGDRFYTGSLRDPRTTKGITDRQLEMRLHTIGVNPLAKRQADMIMAVYPMLREHHQMDVTDQLAFLDQLIQFCPWNEAAWHAVADISREGLVTKSHTKMMMRIVNGLFVTFAAFPDFTWEVFDDLIAFQDLPKQRALLFGQLTALYEAAKRPDLSCKARLRYTDYLVEDDRTAEAIQGLAASILQFPAEGRYVPKMLDRMEALCAELEGTETQLLMFYSNFLPKIPKKRNKRPSSYCLAMHRRAIKRFREAGQEAGAQQLEATLATIRGD
jgi:putative Ig domain-containing protein